MTTKRYHIYFGATREGIAYYPDTAEEVSLRGWLLKHDTARLLSDNEPLDATEDAVKIGIAGPCGKRGEIFGHGVEQAAEKEAKRIHDFLLSNPEYNLIVLGFGYSRGAIGLKLIAEKLSKFSIEPHRLKIHFVLHDPVTGNLMVTQRNGFSLFGKTLTQKSSDLSKSDHIGDVLCLYAQEQGVNLGEKPTTTEKLLNTFFGSQIVQWPPDAYIEEDVYGDNHLFFDIKLPSNTDFRSEIAISEMQRVICERSFAFLYMHGYQSQLELRPEDICSSEVMIVLYEGFNSTIAASKKSCHDLSSITRTSISGKRNFYYNLHHASLVLKKKSGFISNDCCSLRIERNTIKLDFYSELSCDFMLLIDFCNEIHWRLPFLVHDGEKGDLWRLIIEKSTPPNSNIPLNILFVLAIALAFHNDTVSERSNSPKNNGSPKSNQSSDETNQRDLIINILNTNLKYLTLKNFSLLAAGKDQSDFLTEDDLLGLILIEKDNDFFDFKNSNAVYHAIRRGLSLAEKKFSDSYNNSLFKISCDDGKFSAKTRPNQRSFRP